MNFVKSVDATAQFLREFFKKILIWAVIKNSELRLCK